MTHVNQELNQELNQKMKATINVVCYTSKKLANGKHPLMLRVCKDGKKKYKGLGISVNPQHWDFIRNKPKPECPNKELILKLILEKEAEYQNKVIELASYQKEYTASSLLKTKDKILLKTVDEYYQELIQGLISNNKSKGPKTKDSNSISLFNSVTY